MRATGGRRDRRTGVKSYRIRVIEPDRDEKLLTFDSSQDVEARAGDWIVGSYSDGKLVCLANETVNAYWDIQRSLGCTILAAIALMVIITTGMAFVW